MCRHPIATRRNPSADRGAVDPAAIGYAVASVSPTRHCRHSPPVGFAALRRLLLGGRVLRRSRLRGIAASPDGGAPVRGGDVPQKHHGHKGRGGFAVCSVKTSHIPPNGGRKRREFRGLRAAGSGFSLHRQMRTKGRERPFVPMAEGGFSLLVSRPSRRATRACCAGTSCTVGGEIAVSSAISALTPRRKHNILW